MINYDVKKIIRVTLRIIIFATPVVLISYGLYMLSQFGFITISSEGDSNVIINNSAQSYEVKSNSKKLVKKANYNVTAVSNNGSYFTTVATKGFLQNTSIYASPKNIGEASVVGTNPYNCSLINSGVFYSHICTDNNEYGSNPTIQTILKKQVHTSDDTLGYTDDIPILSYFQYALSIVEVTDNEFWVLAKIDQPGSDDENTSATKQIELMRYTDGRLDTPSSIREISIPNAMAMKKYKDGMIIYSKDDVDAYFLSSFEAQPQKINFAELDKIDGYGFDIEIYNNQISYYYKTHIRDTGNTAKINNLPITMVTDLKSPQLIDTPYIYSYAFACGDKNICIGLADENELVIVSGSSKKSVFNVRDYTIINNSLLLQIESTFVLYDVGDNSGTIVYQGNEYNTPCGIQSTFSGVRICVDAKKTGNLYSVQLNLNSPKSTNIIDVINQISENNYVDSVTVLGNIIYINDAVEPVYNEIIGEYLDDPEESAYAEQSIRQTVSETGVDTNKYSVVIL